MDDVTDTLPILHTVSGHRDLRVQLVEPMKDSPIGGFSRTSWCQTATIMKTTRRNWIWVSWTTAPPSSAGAVGGACSLGQVQSFPADCDNLQGQS